MRLIKLTLLLVAFLAANSAKAVPLNASKIGAVWTTTPVAETAFQALTGFRGAFTPMNIGMAVGTYVIISTIGDGINALRVQMASPLPAAQSPAGWSNSESPPTTSGKSTYYLSSVNNTHWPTLDQACAAFLANNTPSYTTYQINVPSAGYCQIKQPGGAVYNQFISTGTECQAGYTYSAPNCILSNPAVVKWPSDGKPTISPVGGILTPNPRDPDNTPDLGAGPVHRIGTDQYNNPVEETITSNPANGIDYKRDTQSVNPQTGESLVQRDQYSTDSTGKITSSTSNVYNNSSISNVNMTATPQTTVDTSSLATDATLTSTNTKLEAIKTDLEMTKPPPAAVGSARTISESNQLVKAAIFSHLPSPTFSDTVPECPTFSAVIPYLNFTMTIDQYCTMDHLIRPVLNIASMAAFTCMGLLIVLRA